jgi:ribonuclease PH
MELEYDMWSFTHGMIATAAGSSYLESSSHKVICTVSSPSEFTDLSSTEEYQRHAQGQLSVQSPFSSTVKSALESMILLEKYPKSLIEVKVQLLSGSESDSLVFIINAASLAILDSGIEIRDTLVASNAGLINGKVKPLNQMTLGFLVNTEKIALLEVSQSLTEEETVLLMQACIDTSRQLFKVIKNNY